MTKLIIKIVEFFKKGHTLKYIIDIFLFFAALAVLLYLATRDVVSNVFGAVVGFLFSSLFLYICKLIGGRFEDLLKINYDTKELLGIYKGRPDYKKELISNGTKVEFAYAPILESAEGMQFAVKDNPDKRFELDDFISGNYIQIFSAHSNSAKRNFDTIRLDDFDPSTNTFHLSRSTYFNHLVTNRAVDFLLFDDVSLRDVFEYGPMLSPLCDSKMSNHIGINALVFLSDDRLLVPRRKKDSTISKNKITSSIAVMLNFPDEYADNPKSAVITSDYLLRGNIIKNLSDRVKLPANVIDEEQTDIEFLGFGQNIYEGGKPQFYFAVTLKNVDTAKYFEQRKEYFAEQKRLYKKELLDVDKCMYAVDLNSYKFKKDFVKFKAYNQKGKAKTQKAGYEMSYLCNLWHYEQNQMPN